MYSIGYDREESTEFDAKYFVYESIGHAIVYKGTYSQCLCLVGAFSLDPTTTIEEVNDKTNGYLFGPKQKV